ncbi:MAG TPA: hypothetical protein VGS22_09325 [Thermoanaerobaculia bacterium]|jgi:hypothetical protein|nr:hypothetical protein [Thermoanaerobaculia bacterium]
MAGLAIRNVGHLAFETLKLDLALADLDREMGVSQGTTPFVNDGTRNAALRSWGMSMGRGAAFAGIGFLVAAKGFLSARSAFPAAEFVVRIKNRRFE